MRHNVVRRRRLRYRTHVGSTPPHIRVNNSADEIPGKIKPSERWTEALKRARLEATISAPRGGENELRRKWRNAKTVIAGLHNDVWDSERIDGNGNDDDDSDEEEKRERRRELERLKQRRTGAKVMESPVFSYEILTVVFPRDD
jgi:hypothetical protein